MPRLLPPALLAGLLLLWGCGPREGSLLPDSGSAQGEATIAAPVLFQFSAPAFDPADFTSPWIRYSTPGGRLSFLHPKSWEVDIAEWSVSRTIHLTSKEGALLPADILFTVYPVEEGDAEAAMEAATRRLREDGMTLRTVRTAADLLSPPDGPPALALFRTTVGGGSALHVFLPRKNSYLEIECIGADERASFPLRVLLESVRYRE